MRVDIVGYPSSAAAYCVGVEQTPSFLRESGLLEHLSSAGHTVRDLGDLPTRWWRPDRRNPRAQNLGDETRGLRELAGVVSPLVAGRDPGSRFLVLGGSCTVALGVCAAVGNVGVEPHVIYLDRHLDLNTPESTIEGSLSWMGMAHALGLEGAAAELADLGHRRPMLEPAHLSYLGVGSTERTDWELAQVETLGLHVTSQATLVEDPPSAARRARGVLPGGPFFVHLDVDALDFLDAPLAENVNGRNSGPTLIQLGRALEVLWQDPDCLGLTLGQFVPAHAAADPTVVDRFLRAMTPPRG